MPTAYEEALTRIESGESGGYDESPDYIKRADTLSIANGNPTFLESAVQFVEDVPKFAASAVISGASQIYNIVPDVGNMLTDSEQFDRLDPSELIADYDSDTSKFYEEHKESVDLAGFMVGSLVPGLAGIKALHAGQAALEGAMVAGRAGSGMSRAMGLAFNPMHRTKVAEAVHAVRNNITDAAITSRTALQAVAAGVHQNVLEGMAYEVATVATMFNSPLLEDQDLGDLTKNVLVSSLAFGVIGGAVSGVATKFKLVGAEKQAVAEARPWTFQPAAANVSEPYEKLLINYETYHTIPEIPTNLAPERIAHLKNAEADLRKNLELEAFDLFKTLSKDDMQVAGELTKLFQISPFAEKVGSSAGLAEVSRMSVTPKIVKNYEKLYKKMVDGTATPEEMLEVGKTNLVIAYTRTYGEGVGTAFETAPKVLSLADKSGTKGFDIKVNKRGVKYGKGDGQTVRFDTDFLEGKVRSQRVPGSFNQRIEVKPKSWDIFKASLEETQARYLWVMKGLPKLEDGKTIYVDVTDIPMLEKVFNDLSDYSAVNFTGFKRGDYVPDPTTMGKFLEQQKLRVANRMLKIKGEERLIKGKPLANPLSQEEIAARVNVTNRLLSLQGKPVVNGEAHVDDLFAHQMYTREYNERMIKAGILEEGREVETVLTLPQHAKMVFHSRAVNLDAYKTIDPTSPEAIGQMNNFIVENMTVIKEQQRAYQDGLNRAAAGVLAEDYVRFADMDTGRFFTTDSAGNIVLKEGVVKDIIEAKADTGGAGAGLTTAASQNYGTLAELVAQAGHATHDVILKQQAKIREVLDPLIVKLTTKQEAYLEWSALQQRVRAIEGHYALNETGDALEPIALQQYRKEVQQLIDQGLEPPPFVFEPGMEEFIPLVNQEVRDMVRAHIEVNGLRTAKLASLRTAQGLQFNRPPEAFYPIPVDPKKYSHFALVTDKSITAGNRQKTLFASSAEELEQMINSLKNNPHLNIKIRTKQEAIDHIRRYEKFDYEKSLNRNYLDVEAKRKGVSSPYIVSTDPRKIADDLISWHMDRTSGLVRESVSAKYEVAFEELLRLGKQSTNIATSKFSDSILMEYVDELVKNPYSTYIKTALDIRNNDYPWMVNLNRMADEAISRVSKKVRTAFFANKNDTDLDSVNRILTEHGYKGAAYDETMEIFANATPAVGTLSKVVQRANGLLATVVLRWDMLNAANNAISANVLLGAETRAIIKAIEREDKNAVGALAELKKLAYTQVPGTGEFILSPTKMIGESIKKFGRVGRESPEFEFFEKNGFMSRISDQYRGVLDDISYNPSEDVSAWSSRLNKRIKQMREIGDKGEALTQNRLAEEFNRFVAADVMKQFTDLAVAKGVMTGKEALAYINTFVNRTQGNYLASQRPQMFQGPLGQAMGLFQTYQFNLMQQLLRHVGEGGSKDAMTLLGLQATIHGMNGLPGFNAVNTHIIGNASGNTAHRDAYDAAYGAIGKEAGDWITYGFASNFLGVLHPDLKINLYTRGDINPRHVTLVPINPLHTPIYQAYAKFFGNMVETGKKMMGGADISTALLQGLEHNGISRPLAGLAQTIQGLNNPQQKSYSTSTRGNLVAANDFLSFANLTRIIGGKPMDEAIALDATYRFKSYGLEDAKRRHMLGKVIKTTMMAGEVPSQEQMEEFAQKYAEIGGKANQFNSWVTGLYKDANLSQANAIAQHLNSPFSKSMKTLMGGEELEGF